MAASSLQHEEELNSVKALHEKYKLQTVASFVIGVITLILLGVRIVHSPPWLPLRISHFVIVLILCTLSILFDHDFSHND